MITLVAYKALNSVNVFFVSCWELGKYSTALKSWAKPIPSPLNVFCVKELSDDIDSLVLVDSCILVINS